MFGLPPRKKKKTPLVSDKYSTKKKLEEDDRTKLQAFQKRGTPGGLLPGPGGKREPTAKGFRVK